MEGGMILESPTIFGMQDGKFLGAGEAGSEAIVGTQSLMSMIRSAVTSAEQAMNISYGGVTINVYGREGQDIRALADEVEERLTFAADKRRAAFA